jgi:tetratricopeptide (TPR) repeat protein
MLIRKAGILMSRDPEEARALLERAYKIVETSLCIPSNYAEIIYNLSLYDGIRGDFDSAIKRNLDVVTIRERAGLNTGNASYLLSILYNVIGDYESGLEWACMAEEQYKSRPYLLNRAVLNQAWSLILLKRLTEAQVLIDTTRESVLKSGDESHLAWLHFVTGLIEAELGNFSLATSSVEQGLRIYERQGTALLTELIFLHQLARIEVRSCSSDEIVSPALAILEDKAVSGNLSGYLGQVLVLKGEIAIINGDEALLREITSQLQAISEKENLLFLKPHFERLVRNL